MRLAGRFARHFDPIDRLFASLMIDLAMRRQACAIVSHLGLQLSHCLAMRLHA